MVDIGTAALTRRYGGRQRRWQVVNFLLWSSVNLICKSGSHLPIKDLRITTAHSPSLTALRLQYLGGISRSSRFHQNYTASNQNAPAKLRDGLPSTVYRLTPGHALAVVCSEECEPPGASFERTHVAASIRGYSDCFVGMAASYRER